MSKRKTKEIVVPKRQPKKTAPKKTVKKNSVKKSRPQQFGSKKTVGNEILFQRIAQLLRSNFKPFIYFSFLFLFFAALAVLFTWPLAKSFNSAIVGQPNFTDGPFFIWNLWWVKKSLLEFQNPLWTNFVYFPQTVNLSLHTLTISSGLIYVLLGNFFNGITSLNIIQIGSVIFSAIGTTMLVNYLTQAKNYSEKALALIGGLIFAFSPFVFSHMMAGHYNLTMLWPIPFVILFLYKTLRGSKIWNAVWLGVFMILLGYLDLQLTFFTVPIILAIILTELFTNWSTIRDWKKYWRMVLALVIFGLVFVWPYSWMIRQGWNIKVPFETFNSADAKILFGLNPLNPVFNYPNLNLELGLLGSYRENNVSLGFTALFVAFTGLFFVKQNWREKLTYFVLLIFSILMALGPFWQSAGKISNLKLPYYHLQHLPFFNIGLVPPRFVLISYFALAVLVGIALINIFRFFTARKLSFIMIVLFPAVVAGVGVEYYSGSMILDSLKYNNVFNQIANEPGEFAVLPYFTNSRDLFLQTQYQKPMVTGSLGRRIHDYYNAEYFTAYPFVHFIKDEGDLLKLDDNPEEILKILGKYKIRYVVVDKKLGDLKKIEHLGKYMDRLRAARVHDDTTLVIYKIN